jgi:anti-sigma-K factor RskA
VRLPRRDPHSLAGPYALDALDAAERDRFERHLRRCAACDEEVRRMKQAATALAMAAAAEPPAGLKERVLAAVAVTPQLPPLPTPEPRAAGVPPRLSRLYPRLVTAVAVVAIAAAAVLGGLLAATQSQLNSARAHEQQVTAVLAAPDARIAKAPVTGGGTATVVVSRTEDTIVFTSSGLPALPSDKVYQLWLLGAAGSARSAGLLPEASNGRTAPVLASGLQTGDKVGMTIEPSGGTSTPTTTPILVMPLPEGEPGHPAAVDDYRSGRRARGAPDGIGARGQAGVDGRVAAARPGVAPADQRVCAAGRRVARRADLDLPAVQLRGRVQDQGAHLAAQVEDHAAGACRARRPGMMSCHGVLNPL